MCVRQARATSKQELQEECDRLRQQLATAAEPAAQAPTPDAAALAAEVAALRAALQESEVAREAERQTAADLQADVKRLQSEAEGLRMSMHSAVATMQGAKEQTYKLEEVQAQLAAQQAEFADLLICLGQESKKMEVLKDLLFDDYGVDVTNLLETVEEEYGYGDEDAGDGQEEEEDDEDGDDN